MSGEDPSILLNHIYDILGRSAAPELETADVEAND
jgi:hypothetical protein